MCIHMILCITYYCKLQLRKRQILPHYSESFILGENLIKICICKKCRIIIEYYDVKYNEEIFYEEF